MCAIAGVVGLPINEEVSKKILKTMHHRGPDQNGVVILHGCTLLHSRLIIIDPEGGRQPMELEWENESYTLVYNGELYNTQQIRNELLRLGHNFTGHSDTEVVLHSYAQWGEACLERFNGIYAFAVWESKKNSLFLARDRMGVKPLFYMKHKGGLLFASEIKSILAYPGVQARIDETGAAELLLLGPGRTPGSGVFKGICELKPGCCGRYEVGKLQTRAYWSLKDREHSESFAETVEHVRHLVMDAIERQMVSDVPFGTFLSGGLDSSIITAVCAKNYSGREGALPSFSVDYDKNDLYFTPGKFQPNSDNAFIEIMRQSLNTEHHWTVLTAEELADTLEEATIARDLPGMADVDFSLLAFCKRIRPRVKMALSGECADEIFGGYPWYRDPEVRALEGFPWAQNTKQRAGFLNADIRRRIDPDEFVCDRYRDTINSSDILPGTSNENIRIKQMVNLNQRWFMQTLLDRKDRMSMYCSLEVRVPFCDHRIAEYLYGVPWEFKDHKGVEKGLLRQAVSDILPEQVLWRKKSPYPKTFDPAYTKIVSDSLLDILNDPTSPIFALVRKEALKDLLEAQYAWPWYGQLMRVPQTIAYFLQINFWLKHYQVSIE